MTSEQMDELERLARAATPGPWETDTDANAQQLVLARQADFWVALLPHQCLRSLEVQQEKNAAYIAAATPDAVLALIARVRELEAERDEWRALTITPRDAQYYIDKAAQAEAERDRLAARVDKAEDHAQQVSAFAAKMIGHACERHADTIQKMSFNEFYSEMPRSCHWCADERVTALEAERDRLAAEHTRLREALERIADMAMTATVKGAPPLSGYRVRQIVDAALAALTPAREESPDA